MNRIALSLVLALTASAASAGSIEEAREKLRKARHEGHKAGAVATTTVAAPAATGVSATENLRIGIEYRGAIKKTDNNIGSAVMRCRTTGTDTFEVVFNGHAVVPKSKKKVNEPIDFEITRTFQLVGQTVKHTGGTEKFSAGAEKYKAKILNMLAIAYLIKFRSPIYGAGDAAPTVWEVDAKKYQLSYVKLGGREIQVSLNDLTENNRFMGKFFLAPAPAAPSPFKKFRIQTKEQLGINFVTI